MIHGLRRGRWPAACLTLVCWGGLGAGDAETIDLENAPFRVAMSSKMFAEINMNDAKAAIKAWANTVAKERGIVTDTDPKMFEGAEALAGLLRSNLVDAASMTADEFADVSKEIPLAPIFVSITGGSISEEYVLLVHQTSPITHFRELGGRSLSVFQSPRTSLAEVWLDSLLLQEGLMAAGKFCKSVTRSGKLSKAVLPVFFHQNDACLVTRRGFGIMSELNPQVGKQLRVIAVSKQVVPAVFCFRASYNSKIKNKLFAGLLDLHTTPAGQQVLTVFQSDKLEQHPVSCLDSAFELLATYNRLLKPSGSGKARATDADQKE